MFSFLRDSKEKLFVAVLAAAWLVSLVLNLETSPLQLEEPRRALIAQEMMFRGNYVVPTEKGEFYYKKPPLFNWVLIASFKAMGGATEFAARIPTVVSFVLFVLFLFFFVRKYCGSETALISALLFATAGDIYFFYSFLGEIDVFFSLISFVQILSVWHFYRKGNLLAMFLVSYGLCAAGILTKGFPSILFQGFTVFVVLLLHSDLKKLFSWKHFAGLLFCAGLLGIYVYSYSFYNNPVNFLHDLWTQSSKRTVSHTGLAPLFLYFIIFPFGFLKAILPAGLFAPLAADREARRQIFGNDFLKFCFWALLANVAVYWVSPGARSRYMLMLHPLGVILLAALLVAYQKRKPGLEKFLRIFSWGILGACVLGGVVGFFVPALVKFPGVNQALVFSLLIFAAGGIAIYFLQPRAVLRLVFLVVMARLGFDLVVFPLRNRVGEHVQVYQDALRIADLTKGQPLWLKTNYPDGVYSLESVFYIERSRQEVLRANPSVNCSDFFIIKTEEAEPSSIREFFTYFWKGAEYKVVKFRNCGGEDSQ